MPTEVTDPNLLSQLNGSDTSKEITDPGLLARLNATPPQSSTYQTGGFLHNVWGGLKKDADDVSIGLAQRYASLFEPNIAKPLQDVAAKQKAYWEPLQSTVGGNVGQAAGYALPSVLTGGLAGGAAMGAALGAAQPTTEGESALTNAVTGGITGAIGNKLGNVASNWATKRAALPLAGWTPNAIDRAAAQAVGTPANKLDQAGLKAASDRFSAIFGAARSPNVTAQMSGSTVRAIDAAANGLNRSSQMALRATPEVSDLLAHAANGQATAEQLGTLSSRLGQAAASQMKTQGGDRALGRALYEVQDHVDTLVGNSIRDPVLKGLYDQARPQYRAFLTLSTRPTILNSATGRVNPEALGKYLQRTDKKGYTYGGNQSPLYQAARYGQATGSGVFAPSILHPAKWMAYQVQHNPLSNAAGGVLSRGLLPVKPALPPAVQGLMAAQTPGVAGLLSGQ